MSRSELPGLEDQLDSLLRHLRERIHRGDFVPGQRLIETTLNPQQARTNGLSELLEMQ